MKKYAFLSAILFLSAALLCGCKDYHPTNSPRNTMTMKSNILTTVTTVETVRAETYSEYISSLKEAAAEFTSDTSDPSRQSRPGFIGGMQMDTAVSRNTDTLMPAQTAVTAVPQGETMPAQTAVTRTPPPAEETPTVTTVPEDASDNSETTSTCATTSRQERVTAPPFDIADIPPVPSADVKRDTAVTRAGN